MTYTKKPLLKDGFSHKIKSVLQFMIEEIRTSCYSTAGMKEMAVFQAAHTRLVKK